MLTGDFQLRRTDIVMDVGNPINPAIDIGQVHRERVEGGTRVAGAGWQSRREEKAPHIGQVQRGCMGEGGGGGGLG